jgi:hypothetical protein
MGRYSTGFAIRDVIFQLFNRERLNAGSIPFAPIEVGAEYVVIEGMLDTVVLADVVAHLAQTP